MCISELSQLEHEKQLALSPHKVTACLLIPNLNFVTPKLLNLCTRFMSHVIALPMQSSPDLPVVVAGDLARQHMKQVDEDGAIPYPKNLLISLVSSSLIQILPLLTDTKT